MSGSLRTVLLVLAFLAQSGAALAAGPVSTPKLAERVIAGSTTTFADLVRLVVPGLTIRDGTASGERVIAVRDIDAAGPSDEAGPTPAVLSRLEAVPVRSGGRERVALLMDFGAGEVTPGFVVLALFAIDGAPRLLDAANVGLDRDTSFLDPGRLRVGAGDDMLLTRSSHFNAGQNYSLAALILVRDDRLELVDTILAFSDMACSYARTQTLDVRQGEGTPFADVVVSVTEETTTSGQDCEEAATPEPGNRTIAATYRWVAGSHRYRPDTDALRILARETEERF
jgi:hypothetical protein